MRWRWLLGGGGGGFAALLLGGNGIGWWLSAPGYDGPVSDHFDGTVFTNAEPTDLPGFTKAVRYFSTMERGPWDDWRDNAPQPPPPGRVSGDGLHVTFINHATTLIQLDGLNVLTDPIWSERCSAVQFAGPRRHHAPGVALEDLPPIDVIVISHNHYDHLDLPTLRALEATHHPLIVTGLGNGALLRANGMDRVTELDWGDQTPVGPVTIHGQQTRHFSSRGLYDRMQTLWLGFVLEAPAGNVYIGGDTGYGPHFAQTGDAFGPFRLALLPVGAYAPRWFMGPIHVDPQEAVRAHLDLGAQTSVGIHFGTFRLSDEGQDDPKTELAAARAAAGLSDDTFVVLAPGAGLDVPPVGYASF